MLDWILCAGIVWGLIKIANNLNEILGYGPGGRRPERSDGSRRPYWESQDDSMDLHRRRNHALRNICDLGDGLD